MELRKIILILWLYPRHRCTYNTGNGQPVYSSDTFIMQATSAETNVSISSYLGLRLKY